MPIALVASVAAGSSTNDNVTTAAINTTGANLIVVVSSVYALTYSGTLSDNKSNGAVTDPTWVLASGNNLVFLTYWLNPATVGSGHTFTLTTTNKYPTICVAAFSGVKTSAPTDTGQTENSAGAGSTSLAAGSLLPSEDNELLIMGICREGGTADSITGGFTIASAVAYVSNQHFMGGLAYKIQTSRGAENPSWSWTTGATAAAILGAFKAPAAAPSGLAGSLVRGKLLQRAALVG